MEYKTTAPYFRSTGKVLLQMIAVGIILSKLIVILTVFINKLIHSIRHLAYEKCCKSFEISIIISGLKQFQIFHEHEKKLHRNEFL